MNRNDEFTELLGRLEDTPGALDYTVERARARKRSRRTRRAVFAPLGSLVTVFAVFALMVNISPAFAAAMSNIPILKDLAELVSISPSLSAALDNDYVQVIDQGQTKDGISARVECVIVDQKRLEIYYTLSSDEYGTLSADPRIKAVGGGELTGFSLLTEYPFESEHELRNISLNFSEPGKDMPDSLILELGGYLDERFVHDPNEPPQPVSTPNPLEEDEKWKPEIITSFSFTLEFDPYFTEKGEVLEINQDFEIDGQKLTLESAEVYPTHMRLVFGAAEENSAWLKGLKFYVENEDGAIFDNSEGGISASGDVDSPAMLTYYLSSPYFSDSKSFSLYITEAQWLEKDKLKIEANLGDKTIEWMPEGIVFDSAERRGDGWELKFSSSLTPDSTITELWFGYYNAAGEKEYPISSSALYSEREDGESYLSYQMLLIDDYPDDVIWLEPLETHRTVLEEPVEIGIK